MTKHVGTIDIRCPRHPRCLLLRVAEPQDLDGQNLLEISCRDCRKDRRTMGKETLRVIHRFTTSGQHVDTIVIEGK